MNAQEKIIQHLNNSERLYGRVMDWGKDSVNGILKIDMGKYSTMVELKKATKLSASTIYKASNELEKMDAISITKPFMIHLKEKHLH